MSKTKSYYECSECGYRAPKYYGKCPSCSEWGTLVEIIEQAPDKQSGQKRAAQLTGIVLPSSVEAFKNMEIPEHIRRSTGIEELDRVLGGGIVLGSALLIAGEPGIGKSTLLMQISGSLSKEYKVLYVSGEESGGQLKYRAERLAVSGENLYILTETNIDVILEKCREEKPDFIILDSIQTLYTEAASSGAGSVSQVRECAMRIISLAKAEGISVMIVGHVNKEGSIAGPKVLEHMVDAVICFEGERRQMFRILRATKNRFGATNELGVFEMTSSGLEQVPNPSEMLLSGRPKNISGNCAVCVLEGTRPVITEIQALTTQSVYPSPKRTSDGIDFNRTGLILAVLEKRLGLRFSSQDVYVNVTGGLRLDEPASDLALALSLISSIKDIPLDHSIAAFGEIGLAGECRAVNNAEIRISEAAKLGFESVVIPESNYLKIKKANSVPNNVKLIPIKSIYDALRIF